jgi:hypothetical protein
MMEQSAGKKRVSDLRAEYCEITGLRGPYTSQTHYPPIEEIFALQLEMLKALGMPPSNAAEYSGVRVEKIRRVYSGEWGYEELKDSFENEHDLSFGRFVGLTTLAAQMLAMADAEYADWLLALKTRSFDQLFSPEVLPALTGLPREKIDAFLDDPSNFADGDKYILASRVLQWYDVFTYTSKPSVDGVLKNAQQART